MNAPNYKHIYKEMLKKYGIKADADIQKVLKKKQLNSLDVIFLNQKVVTKQPLCDRKNRNTQLRSYDKESIDYILNYQELHKMTIADVAKKFKISRNTIGRWKKEKKKG
ncbi:helix-turn-helix domain-containing protein [Myroides ceti]|uniref:Helix-turn-helix domain-containing protein n=1 Tax=Paenimyroides ceti TaxID=395087 RepID=A0ABT8CPK5_9FLAO|nr:helix-turn-helix domain-containing protein [Paenimyroides ceti]MDN3706109.1 helix-turn-helix domain-containing protein [Paenimyroides ceti]